MQQKDCVNKMKIIDKSGFTNAMEKYLINMVNVTGKEMRDLEQLYAKKNVAYKEDVNKIEGRIDAFSEALMFLVTNRKDQ